MKKWKLIRQLTAYLDATLDQGRWLNIRPGTILKEITELNGMVRVTWPEATESAWVHRSELEANGELI